MFQELCKICDKMNNKKQKTITKNKKQKTKNKNKKTKTKNKKQKTKKQKQKQKQQVMVVLQCMQQLSKMIPKC